MIILTTLEKSADHTQKTNFHQISMFIINSNQKKMRLDCEIFGITISFMYSMLLRKLNVRCNTLNTYIDNFFCIDFDVLGAKYLRRRRLFNRFFRMFRNSFTEWYNVACGSYELIKSSYVTKLSACLLIIWWFIVGNSISDWLSWFYEYFIKTCYTVTYV